MTRQKAITAMQEGHKVTRPDYFADHEWISMKDNEIISEEGVNHGHYLNFFAIRKGEHWEKGWEVFKEVSVDSTSKTENKILNTELSFDQWFDIFVDKVEQLGYTGIIDRGTFEQDYQEGKSPESSAQEFVNEMKK